MENKKTFIKLLMDAVAGYVFTLGFWNQPHTVIQ